MKIRFGHSPDPDDAFMFYAIAKKKIPLDGFEIEHVVKDIEWLNRRAMGRSPMDATAVSVHAFAYVSGRYAIMRSGASVGRKYGPIVVARKSLGVGAHGNTPLHRRTIAIPGKWTTANLVLQLYESDFIPVVVPFDRIMKFVADGRADAGLIIHEGQITYKDYGLKRIMDLGEWWWEKTKLPLPLGIDVVRRDLGKPVMKRLARVFKESILYGLAHRKEALCYAIQFGRGLQPRLNDRFVKMYVNCDTVDLGKDGEKAIRKIFELAAARGILKRSPRVEFV